MGNSLGCCTTRQKFDIQNKRPQQFDSLSMEQAHLQKRRQQLCIHRLQYPDILQAFMVRANAAGFLCKEDFIAGLMQLRVRIFSPSKDNFTNSKQDLQTVVSKIDQSIYWTRFYSLFRQRQHGFDANSIQGPVQGSSNTSYSSLQHYLMNSPQSGNNMHERAQHFRSMSPGCRMSATSIPNYMMSPGGDDIISTTTHTQFQGNQQNNTGRNPSSSLYSTNSSQVPYLFQEMKFNYKSVILGFMYLTQIPIIEKARYMFVLLSQLRPVYETKMFSSKLQTKAQPTITRDDIRYTFQIFINITTTYLPTLSSDAPLQYRDKMKEQQKKWSSHSMLYLRSLIARFPDLSAISEKMFIQRVKNEQIACVFDHHSLIQGLQRFIFRKEQQRKTGWGSPKSPQIDRNITPQPIQMKKKKYHSHHHHQQDEDNDPTPQFESRRYMGSQSVISPSAKGRGDQIFRKTVSPLTSALRDPQFMQFQNEKKPKTKPKQHKSKTSRVDQPGIYRNRVISQQPELNLLMMQNEIAADLQNFVPDRENGGFISPSMMVTHSNMMKSINQEKKILFSKSNLQGDKQQQYHKQNSRNNASVRKVKTERKIRKNEEGNK